MINVSELTDRQSIDAAEFAVEEWIRENGLEAVAIAQSLDKFNRTLGPVETSVRDPSTRDVKETAKLSREMLQIFLDSSPGRGPNYRALAESGIRKATEPHGHVLEPVSALITGSLFIGVVLAVRLKKIGKDGVEFDRGLPKLADLPKLGKVIAAVATTFGS
jgi:hypothetical protein